MRPVFFLFFYNTFIQSSLFARLLNHYLAMGFSASYALDALFFMNTADSTLNKYKAGSFMELFSVCLPLILTAASGSLLYFFDRVILARYSIDAMNASASGWMACAVLQIAILAVASITEVFVGQYNVANCYRDLGAPVWKCSIFR